MSEYIELKRVELALGSMSMLDGKIFVEDALAKIADLPTIEVSESNEPTWEQVKEYCFKRNFAIVGREIPKEYLRGFAEVCEDAISREWVGVNMMRYGFHAPDMTVGEFQEKAPSVIPQPKEGEWLRKDGRVWSECSACGAGSSFETKFCGSCGSRMKGAE